MPAGVAPPGFHGKPGRSGRKSAYQEHADARTAHEMFYKSVDLEKIKRIAIKLKEGKGKVSVKEVMLAKAVFGNEGFISLLANKVMATKHEIQGTGSVSELLSKVNDSSQSSPTPDRETPADREQESPASAVPAQPDPGPVQPTTNA